MSSDNLIRVRPIAQDDFEAWLALWSGYNAFYGRLNETALDPEITRVTWQRFFDANVPVYALVAESEGTLIGLAHCLYHHSTTRVEPVCYLQDLFTDSLHRGRGVGRLLIQAVADQARASGIKRVYWQTHESNSAGRLLYDKVARHAGFIVYGRDNW